MAAPFSAGALQVTVTSSLALDQTVVGASGCEGAVAARIATTDEKSENPSEVRDYILN